MFRSEKLKQKLDRLEMQESKWKGRKSRYWFLLPTGGNGFLALVFTLDELHPCVLNRGDWIAVGFSSFLILLGLIICLTSIVKSRSARQQINDTLRKF